MASSMSSPAGTSSDTVRQYFKDISTTSLLDRDQEASLGRAVQEGLEAQRHLADHPDLDPVERLRLRELMKDGRRAQEQFVEANLRLVVFVAKRYRNHGVDFLDLMQEGNLGLIRAVEKYDWRQGLRFSTYATWWIRQAISRALAEKAGLVRLPEHARDQAAALFRARDGLRAKLEREPTLAETAVEANVDYVRAAEILRAANAHASLSSELSGGEGPVIDALADETAIDPFDGAVEHEQSDQIRDLLDRLDHRQARILELHFGLDGNKAQSFDEIGRLLGISRERVRQIETRALMRLRYDDAARTLMSAVSN